MLIFHVVEHSNMPPKNYKEIQVREEIYNEFVQVCKDMNAVSYSDCLQRLIMLYYKYKTQKLP